mgnify:CR=1 FL=1
MATKRTKKAKVAAKKTAKKMVAKTAKKPAPKKKVLKLTWTCALCATFNLTQD